MVKNCPSYKCFLGHSAFQEAIHSQISQDIFSCSSLNWVAKKYPTLKYKTPEKHCQKFHGPFLPYCCPLFSTSSLLYLIFFLIPIKSLNIRPKFFYLMTLWYNNQQQIFFPPIQKLKMGPKKQKQQKLNYDCHTKKEIMDSLNQVERPIF